MAESFDADSIVSLFCIIEYNEEKIPKNLDNLESQFTYLLTKFGCLDAYFLYKRQKIYVSNLTDGIVGLSRAISFVDYDLDYLLLFFIPKKPPFLQYDYPSQYFKDRPQVILPKGWFTTDPIYNSDTATTRGADNRLYKLFSVGKEPVATSLVTLNSQTLAGGVSATLKSNNIIYFKVANDGVPYGFTEAQIIDPFFFYGLQIYHAADLKEISIEYTTENEEYSETFNKLDPTGLSVLLFKIPVVLNKFENVLKIFDPTKKIYFIQTLKKILCGNDYAYTTQKYIYKTVEEEDTNCANIQNSFPGYWDGSTLVPKDYTWFLPVNFNQITIEDPIKEAWVHKGNDKIIVTTQTIDTDGAFGISIFFSVIEQLTTQEYSAKEIANAQAGYYDNGQVIYKKNTWYFPVLSNSLELNVIDPFDKVLLHQIPGSTVSAIANPISLKQIDAVSIFFKDTFATADFNVDISKLPGALPGYKDDFNGPLIQKDYTWFVPYSNKNWVTWTINKPLEKIYYYIEGIPGIAQTVLNEQTITINRKDLQAICFFFKEQVLSTVNQVDVSTLAGAKEGYFIPNWGNYNFFNTWTWPLTSNMKKLSIVSPYGIPYDRNYKNNFNVNNTEIVWSGPDADIPANASTASIFFTPQDDISVPTLQFRTYPGVVPGYKDSYTSPLIPRKNTWYLDIKDKPEIRRLTFRGISMEKLVIFYANNNPKTIFGPSIDTGFEIDVIAFNAYFNPQFGPIEQTLDADKMPGAVEAVLLADNSTLFRQNSFTFSPSSVLTKIKINSPFDRIIAIKNNTYQVITTPEFDLTGISRMSVLFKQEAKEYFKKDYTKILDIPNAKEGYYVNGQITPGLNTYVITLSTSPGVSSAYLIVGDGYNDIKVFYTPTQSTTFTTGYTFNIVGAIAVQISYLFQNTQKKDEWARDIFGATPGIYENGNIVPKAESWFIPFSDSDILRIAQKDPWEKAMILKYDGTQFEVTNQQEIRVDTYAGISITFKGVGQYFVTVTRLTRSPNPVSLVESRNFAKVFDIPEAVFGFYTSAPNYTPATNTYSFPASAFLGELFCLDPFEKVRLFTSSNTYVEKTYAQYSNGKITPIAGENYMYITLFYKDANTTSSIVELQTLPEFQPGFWMDNNQILPMMNSLTLTLENKDYYSFIFDQNTALRVRIVKKVNNNFVYEDVQPYNSQGLANEIVTWKTFLFISVQFNVTQSKTTVKRGTQINSPNRVVTCNYKVKNMPKSISTIENRELDPIDTSTIFSLYKKAKQSPSLVNILYKEPQYDYSGLVTSVTLTDNASTNLNLTFENFIYPKYNVKLFDIFYDTNFTLPKINVLLEASGVNGEIIVKDVKLYDLLGSIADLDYIQGLERDYLNIALVRIMKGIDEPLIKLKVKNRLNYEKTIDFLYTITQSSYSRALTFSDEPFKNSVKFFYESFDLDAYFNMEYPVTTNLIFNNVKWSDQPLSTGVYESEQFYFPRDYFTMFNAFTCQMYPYTKTQLYTTLIGNYRYEIPITQIANKNNTTQVVYKLNSLPYFNFYSPAKSSTIIIHLFLL